MYIKIILYSVIMVFITSCNDNTTHSQVIDDNNKAVMLEEAGKYAEALKYYKKALDIEPENTTVWLGVGDVYYKQKQLPLSFEAYLHACADQDARQKVEELYRENRYKTIDDKNQFNEESLSLLLNAERMKKIDTMLNDCLGKTKSTIIIINETKPGIIFRNIHFKLGKSELEDEKKIIKSLQTFVNVWNKYDQKDIFIIKINSDTQDPTKVKLSVDRAFTISNNLEKLKIPKTCIGIAGYGIPVKYFDTNRRVEIEMLSRKCI